MDVDARVALLGGALVLAGLAWMLGPLVLIAVGVVLLALAAFVI